MSSSSSERDTCVFRSIFIIKPFSFSVVIVNWTFIISDQFGSFNRLVFKWKTWQVHTLITTVSRLRRGSDATREAFSIYSFDVWCDRIRVVISELFRGFSGDNFQMKLSTVPISARDRSNGAHRWKLNREKCWENRICLHKCIIIDEEDASEWVKNKKCDVEIQFSIFLDEKTEKRENVYEESDTKRSRFGFGAFVHVRVRAQVYHVQVINIQSTAFVANFKICCRSADQ